MALASLSEAGFRSMSMALTSAMARSSVKRPVSGRQHKSANRGGLFTLASGAPKGIRTPDLRLERALPTRKGP
jgi:hypothetical protein